MLWIDVFLGAVAILGAIFIAFVLRGLSAQRSLSRSARKLQNFDVPPQSLYEVLPPTRRGLFSGFLGALLGLGLLTVGGLYLFLWLAWKD